MKKIIMYISFIMLTLLILANPHASIEYARQGLILCYEMIIPSLFPFFVCSGLLIYSGFTEILSRMFTPVMLPLFRINGSGAAAFVLGIISGYPLGAVTACSLYENNYLSKTEAERLLSFCNNSGPLFILGAIGVSLYGNPLIGWVLYLSHLLAAVSVGIIFRFYGKNDFIAPPSKLTQPNRQIGEIFSIVLQSSISGILTVCGAIIFFSAAANLLINLICAHIPYADLFAGLIEFTTGIVNISDTDFPLAAKLIMSSFVVGFAGLSVHFQVMGIVAKYKLSLKPYIIGKLLHAAIAAAYMYIFTKFVPLNTSVFTNAQSPLNINGSFAVSSLFVCTAAICITAVGILFGIWKFFVCRKGKKI